jgi:hypothetical protein
LAHAEPNASLLKRLWRVYERAPEHYTSIARYLERYTKFPSKAGESVLDKIRQQDLYPAVAAEFVRVCRGRLRDREAVKADSLFKAQWHPKSMSADLLAYLGCWLIERGRLTFRQTEYACLKTKSWWSRAQMVSTLTDEFIGGPSLGRIVNRAIREESDDVALAASMLLVQKNLAIESPRSDLNPVASAVLKEFGLIRRGFGAPCEIERSLKSMSRANAAVNWKVFFGSDYRHAEKQIVECRGLATTNATAWVNGIDVFLDWLLIGLYRQDPSLGIYQSGGIGSVMTSTRLKAGYPHVQALVESIHQKRYGSNLSHAKEKRTGKPTRAVRFSYLRTAHRLIRAAVAELGTKY